MTKLLDQALEAVRRLPAGEQDEIARLMMRWASGPADAGDDDIAELDRRACAAAAGPVVAHDDVSAWLATWGTPAFKPWSER
ncbi:hypothetical protein [Blastochloris tepida]|jgi:predicted transcriptional regulator|uniref:Uncharacterized protein n=1 Tax=Blastochloris tepida TaxID=2233851 RepID=A0A348G125_9HYPH|nr:hypothetical protein [Blastochloris tepida]BBF93258.1 hypothetical protein BLTE_19430 [Blastochloris tepida]